MRLPSLAALLVLIASCRCAQLDDQLIFRCGPNGQCDPGQTCEGGWCVVSMDAEDAGFDAGCVPTFVCSVDDCGHFDDDGCGGPVDCGGCPPPMHCGLLRANRCDCVKADAGEQVCAQPVAGQVGCGTKLIDNCGTNETFTCGGGCPNGATCVDNICCDPEPDTELCNVMRTGFTCGRGEAVDRCGTRRIIECPRCEMGELCVYGDFGSTCVPVAACEPENDFEFCERRGANCGAVSGMDRCGRTRANVVCGGACDAGTCSSTQPNQCTCQPLLSGCALPMQCCGALDCGTAGLCCVPNRGPCSDDSDCCEGNTVCQADVDAVGSLMPARCCSGAGRACSASEECCSGLCGKDGGCQGVDAGNTWDGGEL